MQKQKEGARAECSLTNERKMRLITDVVALLAKNWLTCKLRLRRTSAVPVACAGFHQLSGTSFHIKKAVAESIAVHKLLQFAYPNASKALCQDYEK